jgi:hypothetical protein
LKFKGQLLFKTKEGTHKVTQAQNTPKTADQSHQNVRVCVVLLGGDRDEKLPNHDHHVAKPQEHEGMSKKMNENPALCL